MKVLVVYYSRYGHVLQLARAVEKGVKSVQGVEAVFRRVAEFADEEAEIKKGKHSAPVWEQQKDVPVCTLEDLKAADGIIWGTPTRYGNMIAQMKRLIDSTSGLWMEGAFEGKPAGVFSSTATTHGGQETTMLSMVPPLLHLGMIIVGVPYSTPGMLHTEGRGGTPYGPTTVAGSTNERKPTPEELAIAEALGKRVAEVARALRGK
jgi:NAD(P)H dehydrogenase (quinone)